MTDPATDPPNDTEESQPGTSGEGANIPPSYHEHSKLQIACWRRSASGRRSYRTRVRSPPPPPPRPFPFILFLSSFSFTTHCSTPHTRSMPTGPIPPLHSTLSVIATSGSPNRQKAPTLLFLSLSPPHTQ